MVSQSALNSLKRYNDKRKECLENCMQMLGVNNIWAMETEIKRLKHKYIDDGK